MSLDEDVIINQHIKPTIKLLTEKNRYYGDSWRELGTLGITYRIKDKCNRLINMIVNNIGTDQDITEEVDDILGYAILLKLNETNNGKRW